MANSNSNRPWEMGPSIRARPGEHYNHGNAEIYDIGRAVALIHESPTNFQFEILPIEPLRPQIVGRGNIDEAYVTRMSNDDAFRPVLIGRYLDGTARLLDGYHRATRLLSWGHDHVAAWLLTPAQTDAIRVSVAPAFIPNDARV